MTLTLNSTNQLSTHSLSSQCWSVVGIQWPFDWYSSYIISNCFFSSFHNHFLEFTSILQHFPAVTTRLHSVCYLQKATNEFGRIINQNFSSSKPVFTLRQVSLKNSCFIETKLCSHFTSSSDCLWLEVITHLVIKQRYHKCWLCEFGATTLSPTENPSSISSLSRTSLSLSIIPQVFSFKCLYNSLLFSVQCWSYAHKSTLRRYQNTNINPSIDRLEENRKLPRSS